MDSLSALSAIYDFYGQFVANLPLACGPGCATCCSVNVTVTELEIEFLRQHPLSGDRRVLEQVENVRNRPHFIPEFTTNQLAEFCLTRREPPAETGTHAPGACPLLNSEGLCMVYTHRPFSCRAMLSRTRCRTKLAAEIAPFIYTVNLTIYQLIEHLDRQGRSGNMLDMLCGDREQTTGNRTIPGFPVAPDEQVKHQRFLDKLAAFPAGNVQLAEYFPKDLFRNC